MTTTHQTIRVALTHETYFPIETFMCAFVPQVGLIAANPNDFTCCLVDFRTPIEGVWEKCYGRKVSHHKYVNDQLDAIVEKCGKQIMYDYFARVVEENTHMHLSKSVNLIVADCHHDKELLDDLVAKHGFMHIHLECASAARQAEAKRFNPDLSSDEIEDILATHWEGSGYVIGGSLPVPVTCARIFSDITTKLVQSIVQPEGNASAAS